MLLPEIIPTACRLAVLPHKPASLKILLKVPAGKKTIKKSYIIQMVFPRTLIN
jgi:hypothetical protein